MGWCCGRCICCGLLRFLNVCIVVLILSVCVMWVCWLVVYGNEVCGRMFVNLICCFVVICVVDVVVLVWYCFVLLVLCIVVLIV